MPPLTTTVGKSFIAAAQDMPKSASILTEGASWSFCKAPVVQVRWTRKEVVISLDGELDVVWILLPEIVPRDLPPPFGPHTLLSHCHYSAGPLLLHSCPYFLPDQFSSLFPLYFVKTGDFKARPTLPLITTTTSTLCHNRTSTFSTAASALHFLVALTDTLALATFGAEGSWYCSTFLAHKLELLNGFQKKHQLSAVSIQSNVADVPR